MMATQETNKLIDPAPNTFIDIYQSHYARVLAQVRAKVGIVAYEDVTQEVFLKIHSKLNDFNGESKLSTWIYSIAKNTAIDFLRRNPKFPPPEVNPEHSSLAPDQVFVQQEMSQCVQEQIQALPEDQKSVIELSQILGLKNQEVANHLGITLENVKIRLHRARTQLKGILENKCDLYYGSESQLLCDRKSPLKSL